MNFLFISELLPIDTHASEVVFYRHFKLLVEKGHTVHILTDKNSYINRKKELLDDFHIHILPNRKWYYLSFKPYGYLQKIRFLDYYYLHVKKIIKHHKIDKLIGFVHGNFLIAFSAFVQKKSKISLISFFHDDTNELSFNNEKNSVNNNTIKILNASSTVLIASESFRDNWIQFTDKFTLLYPIPSIDCKELSPQPQLRANNKMIGYSGTVYNEIIPSLDKFSSFLKEENFSFTIIGNNIKAFYLGEKYEEVTCLPLFDTSKQANEYLINTCGIAIIIYPENISDMPWIKTCFPSKFIQYCLLGIPSIIVAPSESAIGKWCLANKWKLYSNTYNKTDILEMLSQATLDEDVINQVNYLKTKIFNPESIHQQFEKIALLIHP